MGFWRWTENSQKPNPKWQYRGIKRFIFTSSGSISAGTKSLASSSLEQANMQLVPSMMRVISKI